MGIYAIGDLHLPGQTDKPMDVFGKHWENHFKKIQQDWIDKVKEDDVVLLPGDLSWAMSLEDGLEDLKQIARLPGKKIILKGNHDYWWGSIGKLRAQMPEGMWALQNDYVMLNDMLFAGTRGWLLPGDKQSGEQDEKIYKREVLRLEMSLKAARAKFPCAPMYVLMHYPPVESGGGETDFSQLIENYGASHVVYGHLHGPGLGGAFSGKLNGVCYHQVSCDNLNFLLYRLPEQME